jgi:hypothetical protein
MEKESKSPAGRKTTIVEYEERMVRVFEMMLYDRLNSIEFRNKASKEFEITTRQADNLWKDAKDRLKLRFEDEREELLSSQIERYFDLLNRCRDSNNRRVEKEVLDSLTKLFGLENTQKLDITSAGEPVSINIILDK